MAHEVNRLSARKVLSLAKSGAAAGWYGDGNGLFLRVGPGDARRWVLVFRWQGKRKEMGLGSISVPLALVREQAADARRVLASGRNPIEVRRAEVAASRSMPTTFGVFADEMVTDIAHGFRNAKHVAQWRMALTTYAAPIRNKPIAEITTDDILGILKPIWQTKAETASRVRGRIERVLDAAKAKGLRSGENPARWRGHLEHSLPKRRKLSRGHHAAMPYVEVPAFLARLRGLRGVSAPALEFTILAAARTGEVLGARWDEIDRVALVWTVPAARMKAGREHRVPLAGRMVEILDLVEPIRTGEYIFPGQRRGRPLSPMVFEMQLRRMKIDNATVHGFRSSFRDWAGEETSSPREIAEAALGHVVGDATERAYRRGDALEKRRALMEAWGRFCSADPADNVVQLAERRKGG